jgi:hypothetical protein
MFLLYTLTLSAQWMGGVAYQAKSSLPEQGAAVYVIRKLPFQFPDIGFDLKGKISYFYSEESVFFGWSPEEDSYHEYTADIFLETNFFTGSIRPFAAFGLGGGRINSDNYSKMFFTLSAQGGLKFFTSIQPYLELHFRNSFRDFSDNEQVTIRNFQIAGAVGVLFNL